MASRAGHKVRWPGQCEPTALAAGARVEARYGGGKKAFPAVVVNVWPEGSHFMLEYNDGEKATAVRGCYVFMSYDFRVGLFK